jgi:hypothetical protein
MLSARRLTDEDCQVPRWGQPLVPRARSGIMCRSGPTQGPHSFRARPDKGAVPRPTCCFYADGQIFLSQQLECNISCKAQGKTEQ